MSTTSMAIANSMGKKANNDIDGNPFGNPQYELGQRGGNLV